MVQRRIGRLFSSSAAGLLLYAAGSPSIAAAQDLPPELGPILREAKDSERKTIEDIAKRLYPDKRGEIDDLIDQIEDEEEAAVSESSFIKGWTGEGALGANLATGNTDEWGANASLDLTREGKLWQHDFTFAIDIREVDGARTDERLAAGYRARRDFDNSRLFAFGSFDYDRNRFQGISRRFTESLGAGYQIIDSDDFKWEASGGPALRQTRLTTGDEENRLGAFLDTNFKWDITDTLSFGQKAGLVIDESNTTVATSSSLTSDLYGTISARLSFDTMYESDPVPGSVSWDTKTRLSIVFGM